MKTRHIAEYAALSLMSFVIAAVVGCRGIPTHSERSAKANVATVQSKLMIDRSQLPKLSAETRLEDFVLFAMLNRPTVAATYQDWVASVERITVERSLPDPRLGSSSPLTSKTSSTRLTSTRWKRFAKPCCKPD